MLAFADIIIGNIINDFCSCFDFQVILIMGYAGACRRDELTNMSINDLDLKDTIICVRVPKTKTHIPRMFVINEENWISLIKKYIHLRPKSITTVRFFLTYRNGHCTSCPIGINTIGQVPKIVATFLKLANPEQYTGHCFRRSSASHLAERGGDLITIKQHGGWKSSTVAEGYIETSLKKKIEVAQMFTAASAPSQPSTSSSHFIVDEQTSEKEINLHRNTNYQHNELTQNVPGITINAKDSCTVNINIYNNTSTAS